MIRRTAHAKINLALHVTGQRDDGYHLLDTLVAFTEFGDVIEVGKPHHAHGSIEVSVIGEFADGLTAGPENLVTSAAFLLRQAILASGEIPAPVEIILTKNLPIASGIGGGSANAAATLLALQEYWGSDVQLDKIALGLGADVPMCLESRPLRATGIGEEISLLDCHEKYHLVLVNPGIGISTPEIFGKLAKKDNEPIFIQDPSKFPGVNTIGKDMRNDLETPARELCPDIDRVLGALRDHDPVFARMSGSGATCFGVYQTQDEAIAACRAIKTSQPTWWCVATQTTVT
ncbi:MAG: 4-(cytidine 5'-diphospho)-2-C-methyl-D-erythritol kinase [Rhizobiaceae bacterium]|nr:4-(cytidine 5'-diphospho)-2-C-methyl-D-erythritol kinase [Rhizobiaceae bacterium]